MQFNSFVFAIFLPIVFIFYWFVTNRNLKLQNLFILIASYVFYGWWDWRFLSLIFISSISDYFIGLELNKRKEKTIRKLLLLLSVFINLGILGFFKYFNFFIESFVDLLSLTGLSFHKTTLNIILPVGISFYTFQTLSYTIDIYRKEFKPTKDIIAFFAFVSFFPQLVAGPIERARNLLPQFEKRRFFSYDTATDGFRQILWGLFKKIVVADNCAIIVNDIFSHYYLYSGAELFLGAFFFSFQIYSDFSGYSDIAIGTAKLFGFNLMRNFAFPYFSRDIAEFWRRWHISLSSWFRDYVYIPLGGSRVGIWGKIRNTFIIFVVSGFWHGSNWTFIVWGLLNAIYFLPLMLLKQNRKNLDIVANNKIFPSASEIIQIIITFLITTTAWIFFRADNLTHALKYLKWMLIDFSITDKVFIQYFTKTAMFSIVLLLLVEWLQRNKQHGLQFKKTNSFTRWVFYLIFLTIIIYFGAFNTTEQFIYFQF